MPVFDINSTEVQNYLQSGKTEQSYPDEVLPRKLSNPTTKKARQCKFEEVTHYEKSARMVGFRTTKPRIVPWLTALGAYYYEHLGKKPDLSIQWVDSPSVISSTDPLKNVTIDVLTVKSDPNPLLYKLTFFVKSGFIQAQGNHLETFVQRDFSLLRGIVQHLVGPLDTSVPITQDTNDEELTEQVENLDMHDMLDNEDEEETVVLKLHVDEPENMNLPDSNTHTCSNENAKYPDIPALFHENFDRLETLETTFVDSINKINCYQQTLKDSIVDEIHSTQSTIEDLNTRVKEFCKPKDTEELVTLRKKVSDLQAEKQSLEQQLKIERNNIAYNEEHHASAIKYEKGLVEKLRKELEDIISSSTTEIQFSSSRMEEKNQEILHLSKAVQDLNKKVSDLQDENINLRTQIANLFDSQASAAPFTNVGSKLPFALLIGTSNIKGINEKKLTTAVDIAKIIAFTTEEAKTKISEWQSREPALVILHVLTNVLKSQDHSACVEDIKSIISDIRKKWESAMCIVSLATPRIDSVKYNMNGQIINAMLRQVFSSSDKVKLLDHSNMCQEGLPNLELLCDDGYHLSEKGCSQLAANMKRAIHSTLQIPIPQRDRSRSRSRYNMYSRGRGRGRGHKSSQ